MADSKEFSEYLAMALEYVKAQQARRELQQQQKFVARSGFFHFSPSRGKRRSPNVTSPPKRQKTNVSPFDTGLSWDEEVPVRPPPISPAPAVAAVPTAAIPTAPVTSAAAVPAAAVLTTAVLTAAAVAQTSPKPPAAAAADAAKETEGDNDAVWQATGNDPWEPFRDILDSMPAVELRFDEPVPAIPNVSEMEQLTARAAAVAARAVVPVPVIATASPLFPELMSTPLLTPFAWTPLPSPLL